ncbi:MAG: metallophosphoesterase [Myxococcota bacterium]|nr:metallophosphoesterase [Myxococcota bacterium]
MRPVFVGDVQGCVRELEALFARVDAELGQDAWEPWLVGDLVNRGPSSLEVLRAVRARADAGRARVVLGNHEVALLRTALGRRRPGPEDTFADVLEADRREGWVDWLLRLPLLVEGRLGATPFAMVHAAVHPDWSLAVARKRAAAVEAVLRGGDRQAAADLLDAVTRAPRAGAADDLARLLTCRSVRPGDDAWSDAPPAPPWRPWHEAWRARGHPYGVVYGHWSVQGLHVAPGLRGLDTGCVHHGRGRDGFLTAWLPDPSAPDPFGVPDDRFVQVRAFARYHAAAPGGAAAGGPGGGAPGS